MLSSAQQKINVDVIVPISPTSIMPSVNQSLRSHSMILGEDATLSSNGSHGINDTWYTYSLDQAFHLKWFEAIFSAPKHDVIPGTMTRPGNDHVTGPPIAQTLPDTIGKLMSTEWAVMFMVRKVKNEPDLHALRSLLELGALAPLTRESFARRLLLPATMEGNLPLVKVLLEAGVDPNTRMCISTTDSRGTQDMNDQLSHPQSHIEVDTPMTALQVAVYNRREDIITSLLHHGATDWRAEFQGAKGYILGSILDMVIDMGRRQEWMITDSGINQSISHSILKTILQFGRSFIAQQSQDIYVRALRHAVLSDRFDLILLLLEYNPELKEIAKRTPWTILEACSTLKDLTIFKFFVQKGFNPNATDPSGLGSAIAAAASHGHTSSLLELRDIGVDINGMAFGLSPFEGQPRKMTVAEGSLDGIQGMTALHVAVRAKNESLARLLLYLGANVNHCCRVYPIQLAAWTGHQPILKMLIKSGADVNTRYEGEGCYCFYRGRMNHHVLTSRSFAGTLAFKRGHVQVADMIHGASADILEKRAENTQSDAMAVLGDAIVEENLILFCKLLSNDSFPDGKLNLQQGIRALILAVRSGEASFIPILLKAGANPYGKLDPTLEELKDFDDYHVLDPWESPFERATMVSGLDTVELFIISSQNVSDEEERLASRRQINAAFAYAVCSGNSELKALLLKHGVEPEKIDSIMGPNYVQQRLHFALQQAAESMEYIEVGRLLDLGAPPDSPNDNTANTSGMLTPLQYAAKYGNEWMAQKLIQLGAAVNAPPHIVEGRTALQLAASKGHYEMIELLVRSGADINARPAAYGGRLAIEAAAEHGHMRVASYLLFHGADIRGRNNIYYNRAVSRALKNHHYAMSSLLYRWMIDCMNRNPGRIALGLPEVVSKSITEEELTFIDEEAKMEYEAYEREHDSDPDQDEYVYEEE